MSNISRSINFSFVCTIQQFNQSDEFGKLTHIYHLHSIIEYSSHIERERGNSIKKNNKKVKKKRRTQENWLLKWRIKSFWSKFETCIYTFIIFHCIWKNIFWSSFSKILKVSLESFISSKFTSVKINQ